MGEKELAIPIIKWLEDQHWDVYQEVNFGYSTRADIVAVRAGKLWTIETKTTLTIAVLEQAHMWTTDFRSIAVPRSHRGNRNFAYRIASDLKIGVIEVDGNYVQEIQNAPFMRINHGMAKLMMKKLRPEHKTALQAGSKGGGYVTEYSLTMERIKYFIKSNPGCTIREIFENLGKGHYSSSASFKTRTRMALSQWENDWCRIEDISNQFHYYVKDIK